MENFLIITLFSVFYIAPCIFTLYTVFVVLVEEIKNLRNKQDYQSDFVVIFLLFIFAFLPVVNITVIYYFIKDFFSEK